LHLNISDLELKSREESPAEKPKFEGGGLEAKRGISRRFDTYFKPTYRPTHTRRELRK
jgi:hypothetical protein